MTQNKYTTNGRKFKHLTKEKRAQIEILLQQGLPKAQIAKAVGIARSTLYNELKRGTVEQMDSQLCTYTRYFSDVGQRVYQANRENSRPCLKPMSFLRLPKEKFCKMAGHLMSFVAGRNIKADLQKPFAQKHFTITLISVC